MYALRAHISKSLLLLLLLLLLLYGIFAKLRGKCPPLDPTPTVALPLLVQHFFFFFHIHI